MIYIIDANNLGGKMKMLGEENFDRKLIGIIKEYNRKRGKKIILVFDGSDLMGDKEYAGDNLTVIYSPKDRHYRTADDKICELVENIGGAGRGLPANEEYALITEDNDLIKRVNNIGERRGNKIGLIKSSRFANKIKERIRALDEDESFDSASLNYIRDRQDREMSEKDIDKINKELLNIWQ